MCIYLVRNYLEVARFTAGECRAWSQARVVLLTGRPAPGVVASFVTLIYMVWFGRLSISPKEEESPRILSVGDMGDSYAVLEDASSLCRCLGVLKRYETAAVRSAGVPGFCAYTAFSARQRIGSKDKDTDESAYA